MKRKTFLRILCIVCMVALLAMVSCDDQPPEKVDVTITCISGTEGCYTIEGSTVTFSGIQADSIYAISGELVGNIVIAVEDAYQFELELRGLSLSSQNADPISIVSGDKVTICAKNGFENSIRDLREATDGAAAISSSVDLDIEGKGSLSIVSEHNNGVDSKDDLDVKNLTLSVSCADNALKGNDRVTITNGNLSLVVSNGDGIKTSSTDVSNKGNQRGNITLSNTNLTIQSAGDGIDAAHDTIVEGNTTLTILTSKFAEQTAQQVSSISTAQGTLLSFGGTRPERPERPEGPGGPGMGGRPGMQEEPADKSATSAKGIKAGNDITISSGDITVKAHDTAIHAGNAISISGGNLQIANAYEGMEAVTVSLSDGNVSIISTEDGINATTTSGTAVAINGGNLYIYAHGDGIDSNSRTAYSGIVFNGGNTVVICNSNANSALDTEQGYAYIAGSVLAITPNGGMGVQETQHCENFSNVASKSIISISMDEYLIVTVSGKTVVTLKAPCNLSSMAVYLGSSSAKFTTASSSSVGLDSNGVCLET